MRRASNVGSLFKSNECNKIIVINQSYKNRLYMTAECGYEDGDCSECIVDDPFCLGDGKCDGGEYNIDACGYNRGDCLKCNDLFERPDLVGDGRCQKSEEYNDKECKWDGGNCIDEEEIQKRYPNSTWSQIAELGDGHCDPEANIEDCGFDDGDCFEINFPECYFQDLSFISNGKCDYDSTPLLNTPECDWDSGDCISRNAEMKLKYPTGNCHWVIHIENIGDGLFDIELNVEECGYDDGDCEMFNEKWPNCFAINPSTVGDSDYDFFDKNDSNSKGKK